jgi:hypothetical protein
MADVQKQFETFHDAIKLNKFEENQTLKEKRDIILTKLKSRLEVIFEDKEESTPSYDSFDQGSYKMGTGVIPLDSDYDIDVGISFKVKKDDYPDPVEVKKWVYDALNVHPHKKVDMRRPCVTVFYQKGDEPQYHVDLAIYSDESCNSDGKKYLAKGKLNSSDDNKSWEISDPKGLADKVSDIYSGDDKSQFIRVIRYLKRWKDYNFSTNGNAAPIGIGLTISAYKWFTPNKIADTLANKVKYNDLQATRGVVSWMLNNFGDRLRVYLPVEPYSELFKKMTDLQMTSLKDKLSSLLEALDSAASEVDPVKACETLKKIFGNDFPVPAKPDTGVKKAAAFSSASASANA